MLRKVSLLFCVRYASRRNGLPRPNQESASSPDARIVEPDLLPAILHFAPKL